MGIEPRVSLSLSYTSSPYYSLFWDMGSLSWQSWTQTFVILSPQPPKSLKLQVYVTTPSFLIEAFTLFNYVSNFLRGRNLIFLFVYMILKQPTFNQRMWKRIRCGRKQRKIEPSERLIPRRTSGSLEGIGIAQGVRGRHHSFCTQQEIAPIPVKACSESLLQTQLQNCFPTASLSGVLGPFILVWKESSPLCALYIQRWEPQWEAESPATGWDPVLTHVYYFLDPSPKAGDFQINSRSMTASNWGIESDFKLLPQLSVSKSKYKLPDQIHRSRWKQLEGKLFYKSLEGVQKAHKSSIKRRSQVTNWS